MKQYEGLGKLIAFILAAAVLAVAVVLAVDALDLPPWLAMIIAFAVIFALAWILRHMESGRWTYEVRRYAADVNGRRVELLFDERQVFLNRLSLMVDGETVDRGSVFYGVKTLRSSRTQPQVDVEVGSGWVGTCTGAIARSEGGEQPMRDVTAAGASGS